MKPEVEVLHIHVVMPQPTIRPALIGTASIKLTFDSHWSIILNDLRIVTNKLDDQQILSPIRSSGPQRLPLYVLSQAVRDEVEGEVWAAFYGRLNRLQEQAQAVQARNAEADSQGTQTAAQTVRELDSKVQGEKGGVR